MGCRVLGVCHFDLYRQSGMPVREFPLPGYRFPEEITFLPSSTQLIGVGLQIPPLSPRESLVGALWCSRLRQSHKIVFVTKIIMFFGQFLFFLLFFLCYHLLPTVPNFMEMLTMIQPTYVNRDGAYCKFVFSVIFASL